MSHGSDQGAEPPPKASIKILLKQAGWKEAKAFFAPGCPRAEASEPGTERRTDAERKAAQRELHREKGLRQINVIAPDQEDARALLVQVAEAIKSKQVRRDILAVLADRELLLIGRKVRRLRGDAADQVRALLKL